MNEKLQTTIRCINQRQPWTSCPDAWATSDPINTSGGMIPTERCAGCGQARLVIEVSAAQLQEIKDMHI